MSLGGIANLDYTILLCGKMEATRAFYRDVMKFPIETDRENWVSFRVGSSLLTLRPRGWSLFEDGKSIAGSTASSWRSVCRRPPSTPAMRNWLLKECRS